jgi:glycosyltransferase involved in cell wall biosynthesis
MIKISVVTAVYNRCETVSQSLDSIFSQTYPFVESVVIDGGSVDGTLELIKNYRSKIGFFVSEKDSGIYEALNKGIKNSTGDVVGFLHSDDVFENDKVLEKIAAIFQNPDIVAVYGDVVHVKYDNLDQITRYWKAGFYDDASFALGWMPPHPTLYVRRSLYQQFGGFNTSYRISADYDCILRFFTVGKINAFYIPEVLVRMRVGGISNRSIKMLILKSFEDLKVVRKNNVGGIKTILSKNLNKISQFWRR